jgi:hypothetical protein
LKQKLEFCLVLELDESTRLLNSEEELRDSLKTVLSSFVRQWTSGSIPKVEVRIVRRLGEETPK